MSNSRRNISSAATINQRSIFASGTFKNVWAAKQFKTGSVYEEHYFEEEMNIIRRTQRIIDAFDNARIIGGRKILLNTPEVWTGEETGMKALVEPMIDNFQKFNSNTGWATITGAEWGEAMQALSHFSYHDSNRQFLLCDLQGGVYQTGYVLSDPVIMSQAQNCGPADLGPDGINSFFQRHRCGRFCQRHWMRPAVVGRAPLPMRQGTSMAARLPTRQSRNPPSRLRED